MRCLMIVHSYFPNDIRVFRESKSLQKIKIFTDVICLRNYREKFYEEIDGYRIYRLPIKRDRTRGIILYSLEYFSFFLLCFIVSFYLSCKNKYIFVQVHNIPNILIACALKAKHNGAKLILDMHEVLPEFCKQRYNNKLIFNLALYEERISIRMTDYLIVAGHRLKIILTNRGYTKDIITVVNNAPDDSFFNLKNNEDTNERSGKFILCYHGLLSTDYPLESVIKAISILLSENLKIEFIIIGDGPLKKKYIRLVKELDIEKEVKFIGIVPLIEIPNYLRKCDAGIVPIADDEYNNTGIPTKFYEYINLYKPVLVSHCLAVKDLFSENDVLYFYVDDPSSITECVKKIIFNKYLRNKLATNAYNALKSDNWSINEKRYHYLVRKIIKGEK